MPDERLRYRPVASGMVKFRDHISAEALCIFFQERQVCFHGVTFEEMLIRKCAKDQNAVWFVCRYDDGKPQTEQERKDRFNRFYEELTDMLKRLVRQRSCRMGYQQQHQSGAAHPRQQGYVEIGLMSAGLVRTSQNKEKQYGLNSVTDAPVPEFIFLYPQAPKLGHRMSEFWAILILYGDLPRPQSRGRQANRCAG